MSYQNKISESSFSKLNIDEIKKTLIDHVLEDKPSEIQVKDLTKPIEREALSKVFSNMFDQCNEIMRIASGIATIKGMRSITTIEISQAMMMKERGIDSYLPTEEW